MGYTLGKVDVYAGEILDQPGGLAHVLEALVKTGANLEFVIARRQHGKSKKGVLFVAPLKGARQIRAASKVGLVKAKSLCSLRLEGPDRPGLGIEIAMALAAADINLRGVSAAALGLKSVTYLAFDSPEDAVRAVRVLKKLLVTT